MTSPLPVLHVAVAVIVRGPHVLICRRPKGSVLGGFWEFPGGKSEPSETPEQTVVREIREELDIQVTPVETLPALRFEYPHALIHLCPVICTPEDREPKPIAVSECRWVVPADLAAFEFPPANGPLVRMLVDRWASGCNPPPAALS